MPDNMDNEHEWQLDRAVCEQASPGPWETGEILKDALGEPPYFGVGAPTWHNRHGDGKQCVVAICGPQNEESERDMLFIARARERWPLAIKERDEAIGIVPGSNDGPTPHCSDCGRRMVWDDPDHPTPTWTCPRCCVKRMRAAEGLVKAVREYAAEALEPDEDDTTTIIRRGRGHTELEDCRWALQEIRNMIDNKNENGGA
jgi:DNA-directed RNA polymerase subunit RPC12/RpoP